MLIMKLGGASVKDAASVRNVVEIILNHNQTPSIVVISAMGKMTNSLEDLANAAAAGNEEKAIEKFKYIKQFHTEIVNDLFGEESKKVLRLLEVYFQEIEKVVQGILLLGEFPPLMYDRIVAFGELISTKIVAEYIAWITKDCLWLDARQLIKTDMQHGQAKVIWTVTEENIINQVKPHLAPHKIIITQGFIASTLQGKTTTLGREGSDFTAAIFAYCLNADKMIVWKDVPGIMNADPKLRQDATKINHLSYEEAVEMTFYGATVIHPKTIQPLYSKKIPLYVRSFKDMNAEGTCISVQADEQKTPIYISKPNQIVLKITSIDFSFMDEEHVRYIYNMISLAGLKVNVSQTEAISLYVCFDDTASLLKNMEAKLLDRFKIESQKGFTLYTVINFTDKDKEMANLAPMVQYVGNKMCVVK